MEIHSSCGTTHCDTEGTLPNFVDVLLFKDCLTNILPFAILCDKYKLAYEYTMDTLIIHTPDKDITFHYSYHGLY